MEKSKSCMMLQAHFKKVVFEVDRLTYQPMLRFVFFNI